MAEIERESPTANLDENTDSSHPLSLDKGTAESHLPHRPVIPQDDDTVLPENIKDALKW